jgi:uncharacterized delta-60 repeat protein
MNPRSDTSRGTRIAPDSTRSRRRWRRSLLSFETLERRTMLDAGAIQFSSATFSVADSAGTVPIVMTRTGGSSGAVSIKLATSDGTAVAGTDYNAVSGSVSFPDGVTSENVNVTVLPDPVANLPGRTVNLTLSNPSGGATLGNPSAAVLTITHVATPGDLDGSFGTNGRVILLPGPPNENVNASPVSPVLIGSDGSSFGVSLFASPSIEVNKFNPDGTPDTSYGTDGLASVSAPGDSVAGCAFQPDGKIVVDGTDGSSVVVVRFNTDGTPDSTFGQGGVVTLAIPTQFEGVIGGITVLSGGQIVVSDTYGGFASAGLALVAFGADGSPSLAFGSGGIATTTLGPNSASRPSVLAMPDGTCVVSGYVGSGGAQQMTLWRFNADGSLDTAFGSGGMALGPAGFFGGGVTLAPNGDIVQVGSGGGGVNGSGGGTVAFYRNDGTLDASFGSGGESDFATMAPLALAFQPSGQVVVIGVGFTAGSQSPGSSVLTRLHADGSLDTGFGQGGFAYDGGTETPNALAKLPDGKILEGATTTDTQDGISGILFELDRYIAPTSISTPKITWADPTDIVYGTPLGATQLDATASVPGTFAYSPALGTILHGGDHQTLSATFTPTNTVDYTPATVTVTIDVTQATPIITWANPTAIVYGTALSAIQLDATSNVPGTLAYSPAAGSVLYAGNDQVLSVTFTPTDTTDYKTAFVAARIDVDLATPTITWANPADIVFGTPLGPVQLDASASVPGTFMYTPAANKMLNSGRGQELSATFTLTDAADYKLVTITTTINVLPAPQKATPVIIWPDPAGIAYGTALGAAQFDATAAFGSTAVAGTFKYTPNPGTVLNAAPGQILTVDFTPDDTTDYTSTTATSTINVARTTPTITWANPADLTFGTPLGVAQLDAATSVPGVFTYAPAAGTVLTAGFGQPLAVTFTPTDTRDYTVATGSTTINVIALPTLPHVTGIVSVSRTKKGLTAITVGFDEALDSGSVSNRAFYHVFGAVKKRKKTVYTKGVGIKGISFDGNSRVTISLAKTYKGAVMVTLKGVILAANGASSNVDFSAVVA